MGILDKITNTIVKKVMIDTAVNAAVKTAGAVADYKSKKESFEIEKISVPNSSEHYIGMNYKNVQDELLAYGFTNIVSLPKNDLINGWLTKDGAVERIAINGRTEFSTKNRFPSDVRIVITYHTFRDSR